MGTNYKITIKIEKNLNIENVNEIKKILKETSNSLKIKTGWQLFYEFKKIQKENPKIQLKVFEVEEILHLIRANIQDLIFQDETGANHKIKIGKQRYKVFSNNHICVSCGLIGSKMIAEKQPSDHSPHLNLYAIDSNDNLVLMTQDHIQPKSIGGKDDLENLQTLCTICNNLKANSKLSPEQIKNLRQATEIYKSKNIVTHKDKKMLINMLRFFMD